MNLTLVLNVAKHGAATRNIAIQRRSSEGFVEIFKVRTLRFKKMAGLPGLTNYKNLYYRIPVGDGEATFG
jgi:hypothetical protein